MDGGQRLGAAWAFRLAYLAGLTLVGLAAAGCGEHDPAPFPAYAAAKTSVDVSQFDRTNAYSDYLMAADTLDKDLGPDKPKLLLRDQYTPKEREKVIAASLPAIRQLKEGLKKNCLIPYEPHSSADARKGRPEWLVLGKVLQWQVEDACNANDYDQASAWLVVASKFGFDLTGGSPEDATLGLLTIDQVRRPLAAVLDKLSALQLTHLATSLKKVYATRPPLSLVMDNAGHDMMQSVQELQDAYRSEDYAAITARYGLDANEITSTMKRLHQGSDRGRAEFFNGLAAEATEAEQRLQDEAKLSTLDRSKMTPLSFKSTRPWKRVALRNFGLGQPLFALNDATSARTQLLILEAQIIRARKQDGETPENLNHFSKPLTMDPYSGQSFVYHTDGHDYKLYSVGDDFEDDSGATDATFTKPDLMLERAR